MTEMKELLPCPFCGRDPQFLRTTGKISCFNNECWVGPEIHALVIAPFVFDYEAAIAAWNNRTANHDPLREALERIYDTRPKAGYLYDSRAHQEVIKIAREALEIHPFVDTTYVA